MLSPGGNLIPNFIAGPATRVEAQGGTVGANFTAMGSDLFASGAAFAGRVTLLSDSSLTLLGGTVAGPIDVQAGAELELRRNVFGADPASQLLVRTGGVLNIYARSFLYGGQPIRGLRNPGDRIELSVRTGVLSAVLGDGSPFSLRLTGLPTNGTAGLSTGGLVMLFVVPECSSLTTLTIALLSMGVAGKGLRLGASRRSPSNFGTNCGKK